MHKNTFNHEWSSKKTTSDLQLNTKSMKMDKNSYAIKELAFPAWINWVLPALLQQSQVIGANR